MGSYTKKKKKNQAHKGFKLIMHEDRLKCVPCH